MASGTATAAGRRLGLSQSAVSRAVASLEGRLGKLLFERAGSRLVPTAEAIAFDRSLDPVFEALTGLDRSRSPEVPPETLRLVAPATFGHRFLPRRVVSYLALHPEQPISLEIIASDALVSGIAEGRFDLGLTDLEVNHSGVRAEPLRLSRAVCCLPANHALVAKSAITAHDLDTQPMIALTRRHSVRTLLDRIIVEAGARPRIVLETATAASAWEFVRAGVGIAVLNPFPVALGGTDGLELRPFEPAITYRTQFLSPAAAPVTAPARAFARHVRLTMPKDAWSEAG